MRHASPGSSLLTRTWLPQWSMPPCAVLLAVLWSPFPCQTWAAEPLMTVAAFNTARPNWATLEGTPIRVEGRVSSHLKGQMRFQNCNVSFLLAPELERRLNQARNVEVTGSLRREGGGFVFDVTDMKLLPTDIEQFRSREAAMKNAQPDDWYELAQWGLDRSAQYNDRELAEAALACRMRGIGLELSRLRFDDYDGRFALAAKAKTLELPDKLSDEIRHEAYRVWWIPASSANRPQPEMLAAIEARLRREWPDALTPGSPFPTDVAKSYAENPTETYRLADTSRRQILRRLFAAEVQVRLLELSIAADGRNGEEIAKQLEQLVPERRGLAEKFRDRALTWRLTQIVSLNKTDAVQLAQDLRTRQRAKDAEEGLLRWLIAKEQRLRPQTAPEFIELADDYFSLLNDEPRAVALLAEAHRREPESAAVLSRLQNWNYVFDGVAWRKSASPEMPSADPKLAVLPTQLAPGMSQSELTRMLGAPTRRSRILSAAGGDEFWIYGRAGEGSRLVIEMQPSAPGESLRVLRFYHR